MPASLQPTLWRTCRVLANRTRLNIFSLLARDSPQTVSSVALRLELPLPVASQALRALEARGLLSARRVGRRVQYRVRAASSDPGYPLANPLRLALRREPAAVEAIFRLCTAFTHPRRIEIFRALTAERRTWSQLRAVTRIPGPSLLRHLGKLNARGFVMSRLGIYSAISPEDAFGRALAHLAGS